MNLYSPTIASEEDWNGYNTYKKIYNWLTFSIYVTVKYNCEINKIDLNDYLALIKSESNGNPNAISSAGAKGLSQIMNCHWNKPEELYSIYLNIRLGTAYYAWCLKYAKGDKREALRFYNAGPNSNKYVYRNYTAYCDVIIRNSNISKNLEIKKVEIK